MTFNPLPFSGALVGMTQFQKMLKDKGQLAVDNTDKELGKLAFKCEAKAKEYQTPHVRTGRLRASIMTEHVRKFYWLVGSNVSYAAHHEFGTAKTKPYPYLRPAIMSIKGDLHRLLARADILKGG